MRDSMGYAVPSISSARFTDLQNAPAIACEMHVRKSFLNRRQTSFFSLLEKAAFRCSQFSLFDYI